MNNPLVIVWRVLEACNLGCSFCAYDKNIKHAPISADAVQIRRFMKVLAEFSSATKRDVLISWLGGEPFLWSELYALTSEARSLGLHISTTTNGTMLGSQNLRRHIIENYDELTISIDGIGDLHNDLRQWEGGFDKLHTNIAKLRDEKIAAKSSLVLRANIVLMRDNIDQLIPLCHEIADWGISVITFNQLGGRDRPEFYPDHRLSKMNVVWLEEMLPNLKHALSQKNVTLLGSKAYMARFIASANGQKMPIENCSPGIKFLFIDEKGIAAPCSFTGKDYGIGIDSLATSHDIAQLYTRFDFMQKNRRSSECDDCHSTQVFEKFESKASIHPDLQ